MSVPAPPKSSPGSAPQSFSSTLSKVMSSIPRASINVSSVEYFPMHELVLPIDTLPAHVPHFVSLSGTRTSSPPTDLCPFLELQKVVSSLKSYFSRRLLAVPLWKACQCNLQGESLSGASTCQPSNIPFLIRMPSKSISCTPPLDATKVKNPIRSSHSSTSCSPNNAMG